MTLNDLALDDETRNALNALSRRMKRSPEEIAAGAIRDAVRDTEALFAALEHSTAQADRGETMTLEEWRAHRTARRNGA